MLILFDVDATLISTTGAGIWALEQAGRERFGPSFTVERTEFAGRLDPLIIRDLLRDNGVEPTAEHAAAMRRLYRIYLERRLSEPGVARPLPGVVELLAALRAMGEAAVLGLLTGNFEETGTLKLRACGIEPSDFPVRVWGDESPHDPPARDHLPPVAIGRYRALYGREPAGGLVTVIGDTPHDVACARAHNCRALGVATGRYTADDLRRAGADLVLPDLSATDEVLRWLTTPLTRPRPTTMRP